MDSLIKFCAQYLFVFVVLLIVIAWLRAERSLKSKFLATAILAGIIALIISRIASKLYYDPRPFVTEHVKPLIAHAADNGFPSDHALFTATLTAVAYFFNKKYASVMLVLTIIVGVARILAKVHSPLDIAAGWVLGVIGAVLAYFIIDRLFKKYQKRLPEFMRAEEEGHPKAPTKAGPESSTN